MFELVFERADLVGEGVVVEDAVLFVLDGLLDDFDDLFDVNSGLVVLLVLLEGLLVLVLLILCSLFFLGLLLTVLFLVVGVVVVLGVGVGSCGGFFL